MEVIERKFNESFFVSNIFQSYMDHLNCVFLDIETTGLNAEFNKVILIGVVKIQQDALIATQFLAEEKDEEKKILESLAHILKNTHVIYNYNASSFDIPFLNKRFQKNNISFYIPKYSSFDLYKMIKTYEYVQLPDYKLKTVEKFLGIQRSDMISGKESIALYNQYIDSYDPNLKEKILKHNLEDIYYLTKVITRLNKYDIHKMMFENSRYLKKDLTKKTIISKSSLKKSKLYVEGFCLDKDCDYKTYNYGYNFTYEHHTNRFFLEIPLYKKEIYSYMFLPDFDIAYKKVVSQPHISDNILLVKEKDAINYREINSFIGVLIYHLIHNF